MYCKHHHFYHHGKLSFVICALSLRFNLPYHETLQKYQKGQERIIPKHFFIRNENEFISNLFILRTKVGAMVKKYVMDRQDSWLQRSEHHKRNLLKHKDNIKHRKGRRNHFKR